MILEKQGYSYNDLTIIPTIVSHINSRADVNPFNTNGRLPIFTAPMSTVVCENNMTFWEKNNITPIIPRNIDIKFRVEYYLDMEYWTALSIKEAKEIFLENEWHGRYSDVGYICIDVANGHMQQLIDLCKEIKAKYPAVSIMTGNIANPQTLLDYENAGIDYVRCSIGSGAGCFIDGTKITLQNGIQKNIENINVGDKVLTLDGSYQYVENTIRYKTNSNLIKINGEITCTPDHKFYVINKTDISKVTEQNIEEYAFWLPAEKLNKNIHILIKRE